MIVKSQKYLNITTLIMKKVFFSSCRSLLRLVISMIHCILHIVYLTHILIF